MTEIKNILITSIGGDISQAVSKIIKEQFDKVKIIEQIPAEKMQGNIFVINSILFHMAQIKNI